MILVGDELLEDMHGVQPGYIRELLDTLGSDMEGRGYALGRLTVAGDTPGELAPLLEDARERNVDLVVTIGGLGPTHDDRVREEVASVMGLGPPRTHPDAFRWLVETFRRKGIDVPEEGGPWERMGQVPAGVDPIHNIEGMAAGLAFRLGGRTEVRCLPGVTFEALPMWRQVVLPDLDRQGAPAPGQVRSVLTVKGAGEGVVGPLVERFSLEHPGIRARINLMDPDGHRFRSIKVTLTGDPDAMAVAVPELMAEFEPVAGVTVQLEGGGGP
jgi:nicotinamide-nucleotide amidase